MNLNLLALLKSINSISSYGKIDVSKYVRIFSKKITVAKDFMTFVKTLYYTSILRHFLKQITEKDLRKRDIDTM